jgi:integrase
MKIWAPEQLRRFLDVAKDDRLFAAWVLYATTGMRRGEVAGLAWDRVDLVERRLSVVRGLSIVGGKPVFSEPKTAKGRRVVPLDEFTTDALRAHRKHQLEERIFVGEAWEESGLVFTEPTGRAINPDKLLIYFRRLAAKADLPRIRLHDVRHSYASAALAAGIPAKVVSERLGHGGVVITLSTYQHVLPSMQEEAAERVAGLILGS